MNLADFFGSRNLDRAGRLVHGDLAGTTLAVISRLRGVAAPKGYPPDAAAGPLSSEPSNQVSDAGADWGKVCQNPELTPGERFHDLFRGNNWRQGWAEGVQECGRHEGRAGEELEQDVAAGNPSAVAAKAAWDALENMPEWKWQEWPLSPDRQRAIDAHRATWCTWREGKAQQACNDHATVLVIRRF